MKVLYVGMNGRGVSPVVAEFPGMLGYSMDIDCYGPGYTSYEILKKGLSVYLENKNYKMVVIDGMFTQNIDVMQKYLLTPNYNISEYDGIIRAIIKEFNSINISKACYLNVDPWHMDDGDINKYKELIDNGTYIIGVGRESIEKKAKLEMYNLEKIAPLVNDRYYNFVNKYHANIVAFPNFVSESLFEWGAIATRKYDVSVVGRLYNPRKVAKRTFRRNGVNITSNQAVVFIMRALSALGLSPYRKSNLLAVYSNTYFDCMKNSKYSFACGMRLRMPLRKFFEIPACGAVMIAYPCKGFENFGFKNGVNAIISDPENVMEAYDYLQRDHERAQMIASNGRQLVWNHHSTRARSEQLRLAFEAIIAGEFSGSSWENGEYIIGKSK